MKMIGIYLAAGKSSRFGGHKLSYNVIGNGTLGSLALQTALQSKLDKVIIVSKKSDPLTWIPTSFYSDYDEKLMLIRCEKSDMGQAYSIKCGLKFAEKYFKAEVIVIMLADQPLITVTLINDLITRYREEKKNSKQVFFIASVCNNIIYPPLLFSKHMFEKLYTLQGDIGARNLIQNNKSKGIFIKYKNSMLFFDVDTKRDYYNLLKKMDSLTKYL